MKRSFRLYDTNHHRHIGVMIVFCKTMNKSNNLDFRDIVEFVLWSKYEDSALSSQDQPL